MLTHENVESLKDFLWAAGVLDGLTAVQAHAVYLDLFWIVNVIVTEAVDKSMEELKVAAVMAASDCLDEQRFSLLKRWQEQISYPQ